MGSADDRRAMRHPLAISSARRTAGAGTRRAASTVARLTGSLLMAAVLAACTAGPAPTPSVLASPEASGPGSPSPDPTLTAPATPSPPPVPMQPAGAPGVIATGLDAPWSAVRLPDGGVLVSERDTARIIEVAGDGSLRTVGQVPGVVPSGEGGLLGLAHRPTDGTDPAYLYAMFTAADDNRIVRMPLTGGPGSYAIGAPQEVLTGIAKAGNHNGGRLAFGPDGFLYATTGDAGVREASQDPASPNGKILRMTPAGAPAPGNPFGNRVWSLGHRNVQGIGWDAAGGMWASEFGQNTWDELNRITRGANYGWPVVEGIAGDERFSDPVLQWATSEASPSGLAVVGDTVFLAALRGERVWAVSPATDASEAAPAAADWFAGELGRIRDVVPGEGDELWVLTNNTDGRGSPGPDDDRLLRVPLAPAG
ncbi:PQQ-dependent sugar dehydrogenase [Agromyces larvae]|uniref:PQQ-dependent sugar dehydrogenase n=1 Tax=Agromyces larvae TaxID=2929802 RepID=A0ABY4BTY4_9MICO|nr:PQQ-dependent sugar dehydrogenase [Agromyces larvae]UOE42665.1 PQQ-dependent sugar dehydrogenase [Agromyces larvae]